MLIKKTETFVDNEDGTLEATIVEQWGDIVDGEVIIDAEQTTKYFNVDKDQYAKEKEEIKNNQQKELEKSSNNLEQINKLLFELNKGK